MAMPLAIYEQSAVASIDIHGLKNALADEAKAGSILDALSHVKKLKRIIQTLCANNGKWYLTLS